jgi:hypothetical protein
LAVNTTAKAISIGRMKPIARNQTDDAAATIDMPIRRSQPECRLGMAAYWLVKRGGWSTR